MSTKRFKIPKPTTWPEHCPKCGEQTLFFASETLHKIMIASCSNCQEAFSVEVLGVEDE